MDRAKSAGFPTTAWTVVSRARSGADSIAREARVLQFGGWDGNPPAW
jgi:hypothetical protein